MQRRKSNRDFTLGAIRLMKDLGVSVAQAARDQDLKESVLTRLSCSHGPHYSVGAGTAMVHFWSFPVCLAVSKQAEISPPLTL